MPEYCVTGGTGFIAANLVKVLLEKGYVVRTTVRDPDDSKKVGFLWSMSGAKDRLKVIKADLLVEGSFDKAVDGVDGASQIDPCIKGTVNVLKSCAKANSVKRVVLTSSCSAIRYRDDATQASPLNESHWSDPEYCKRYNLWYPYAKTLAEKEAWRVAEESGIDLVAVNPSFVVGPLITPQPTSSLLLIISIMKGECSTYPNFTVGFVHIDDVVSSHILAMEDSRVTGRLVCSNSVAHWSEIIEMLKAKYPSYPITNKCGEQKGDNIPHTMDIGKIKQLGFLGFKTLPQMFDDCIKSFQEQGLL
ncbi:tetraketide alpha-pyrone reductase 2-like protein [Cinnamomum micranthum f. kanehirae]|uniref:Tetraketide alpha-pyrone reductase 2-like protein n=1 Tax=Cinnamomum micranthum f. kanehirae TaxID=337451 RepID=A0A3S3N539_9MAGN|nr:tetraketide alpha-pyrone reductase 2-like protein [Cinnamomum micranthum f. kanehirae]